MYRGCTRLIGLLLSLGVLPACVTDLSTHGERSVLQRNLNPAAESSRTLNDDLSITLGAGLSLPTLRRGSSWTQIGRTPQGVAYRRNDDVLVVKTWHQHEAYLVESNGLCVGVFVSGEELFIRATEPVPIAFRSEP